MPSGQPPGSNSIIVGNCIACEGLVRVSAKTKANSNVRCPHCQQAFPLASLLESAVPEVEIVEPDAPTVEKTDLYIDQNVEVSRDSAGKFVVPSQLAKGARRRKSSRSSGRSRSGSEHNGSGRSGSERTSTREAVIEFSPNDSSRNGSARRSESIERSDRSNHHNENREGSHRSTRHRDKRAIEEAASAPNPVVNVLKVFAGAGLALPIAYLIVMWVFARDPLGVGKQIGDRVPFIVPAAFHAKIEEDPDSETDRNAGFDLSDPDAASGDDFGFGNLNIGTEALEGLDK